MIKKMTSLKTLLGGAALALLCSFPAQAMEGLHSQEVDDSRTPSIPSAVSSPEDLDAKIGDKAGTPHEKFQADHKKIEVNLEAEIDAANQKAAAAEKEADDACRKAQEVCAQMTSAYNQAEAALKAEISEEALIITREALKAKISAEAENLAAFTKAKVACEQAKATLEAEIDAANQKALTAHLRLWKSSRASQEKREVRKAVLGHQIGMSELSI